MVNKSIFLHIGSPKTGTTSLQTWLTRNEGVLSDCDVRYLRAFRKGPSHNYLTKLMVKGDKNDFLKRNISNEIFACPEKRILISTETAFTLGRATAILRLMPKELLPKCTVFFYFRRQDLFLEAMAKQKIKNGVQLGDFSEFPDYARTRFSRGNYFTFYRKLSRAFPEISVQCKPFDRSALDEGNVVSDFWSQLGLPLSERPSIPQTTGNKTPSAELTFALSKHDFRSGYIRRAVINKLIAERPELFRSKDILSEADRRKIMESFHEENVKMSKVCGFDLEDVFYNSVDYSTESRVVVDPNQSARRLIIAQEAIATAVNEFV